MLEVTITVTVNAVATSVCCRLPIPADAMSSYREGLLKVALREATASVLQITAPTAQGEA
jgi:hypothetical protein